MNKNAIRDEFTNLPICRQRKHQLRKAKQGLCYVCMKPALTSGLCPSCYAKHLQRQRKRQGVKKPSGSKVLGGKEAMNKDPLPKGNPLEKDIEKKVCDYAKSLGCLVYKFTSPARRSVPDRLFIMPAGRGCFFIEFKRKGCKPTPAQEIEIAKIRKQGITVFVIDNVQDGKAMVDNELSGFPPDKMDEY